MIDFQYWIRVVNWRSKSTSIRDRSFRPNLESLEQRTLLAADSLARPPHQDVDVILEWNQVLLVANAVDHARTSPEQGGPILTARAFAIVSSAMYDAYNSVEHVGEPFLVRAPRAGGANADAAVAQAAHDTLTALYPSQLELFDEELEQTLDRIVDGRSETLGRAVGAYVADRILADRSADGSTQLMEPEYRWNEKPGFHAVDPLHPNQGYYASGASQIEPFAITAASDFAARELDDGSLEGRLAFLRSEEYRNAYDEVFKLGGDGAASATERTEEQTEVGIYWGYDGRPGLGTPPRLYNQIVRTIAEQQGNSESTNARLFALVNIAMADAGIASWYSKYDLAFWRPVLGIRNGDVDTNDLTIGDSGWVPLGAPASNPRPGDSNFTPPFPAYTSGHATFGAAAFQMMARFYGRDDISFQFVSDEFNGVTRDATGSIRPLRQRSFDSLSEAKLENAQSRIYLGIHWAFDRDEGIQQGDAIADYVFEHSLKSKSNRPGRLHNSHEREDVNDDGNCTAIDALIIINEINANANEDSRYFVDVNGDGERTPIDALIVVNRLNQLADNSAPARFVFAIADDRYEDNDRLSTANNLGEITNSTTIESLIQADASDWYRFSTSGNLSSVGIQFQHSQGDLDLALYNVRGQRIRVSAGVTNGETLSLHSFPAGTYFIRVYGYRGATNPSYSLNFRSAIPAIDDAYEDNDTQGTASNLGTLTAARSIPGLVLADTADWYQFTTTATGTPNDSLSIDVGAGQGDLVLELFNPSGQRLGVANGPNSRLLLTGLTAGAYFVRVTGSPNSNYSMTIDPPSGAPPIDPVPPAPVGSFDIQIRYSGLSSELQSVFEQAAARWESIIVGDLPTASFGGLSVDDLLIEARATSIDGVGGVLGQAGPDRFRSGSQLPYHGSMEFDTADLLSMHANGSLLDVVIHEIGHILGIGTLWSAMQLVVGERTSNPLFIGTRALAEYQAMFGSNAVGVPVENSGGPGTRDSHWRESVLGGEIMTGFVGPGTRLPISRITVGSLADLGYSVNLAAADPFSGRA